jgi:CubicO group peptidase (beta-lactamase class C family)
MRTTWRARAVVLQLLSALMLLTSGMSVTQAQTSTRDFLSVDAYVKAQMDALNIPGLALGVVQADQAVYLAGYGIADPSGRPVTSDTPFRIASLTKPLTAIAVMQLSERGVIDLDAPVQRYLPQFQLADATAATQVTVRDLLYHTSGIPQSAGYGNLFNGDLSDSALETNVRQLVQVHPDQAAGSGYQYANLNYDVLGLLIQTMSGQTYEAYMQAQLFTPLEMEQSYTAQSEARTNGMATGYRQWLGFPIPADLPDDRAARPSSFLISTAEDLTHWLMAELNAGQYRGVTLLSSQGIAETQRPAVALNISERYGGMGFEMSMLEGTAIVAKTGGTANYYARVVLVPDERLGVIILTNTFDIGLREQFDTIANNITLWLVHGNQPSVVQAPLGGGNALMKFGLIGLTLFQLILTLRMRPIPTAATRPWVVKHLFIPIVGDVCLIVSVLALLPQLMNAPLRFLYYFAPDIFFFTLVVVFVPLARDCLRATYILKRRDPTQSISLKRQAEA